MTLRWIFVVLWLGIFTYGAGLAGLWYGFLLLGAFITLWRLVVPPLQGPPQGHRSAASGREDRRVELEQGELVNARRGNPDPTRPAEWKGKK